MEHPRICINHRGRLGNKMFQAMLALELKSRAPSAKLFGLDIPEWSLLSPPATDTTGHLHWRGNVFNLDETAWLLNSRTIKGVTLEVWGHRLTYFGRPERYRSLFKPRANPRSISDHQILINVRAEDIVNGWHPQYLPMPFSYYHHLIDDSGLEPVFMGQLDQSDYVNALREEFQNAVFLPPASPLEDFETMRNAKHLALPISSFSWLAGWLSETAQVIHLPVAGLFNPMFSPTMLLPTQDTRYRFYHLDFFSPEARSSERILQWTKKRQQVREYRKDEINALVAEAFIRQNRKRK